MITDAEEYDRLWAALILASPMVLIGLAMLVVAVVWPGRRTRK